MNAVQCTDASWTTNWNAVRNKSWNYYARAPFLTWSNTWYNAPCQTWAAKPGKPVKVDGSKAPGILMISETNDAATPFAGSLVLRRLFPKSVLIGSRRHDPRRFALRGGLHRRPDRRLPRHRGVAGPKTG